MESDARSNTWVGTWRLLLDYDAAPGAPGGDAAGGGAPQQAALDWVCEMCSGERRAALRGARARARAATP